MLDRLGLLVGAREAVGALQSQACLDAVIVAAADEGAGLGVHAVLEIHRRDDEARDRAPARLAGHHRWAGERRPHPVGRLQHHRVGVLVDRVVVVHDHEVAHLTGRQRRGLARLGDEQEIVIGVHRLGVVAPALPELRAEGHAEVDAAAHAEVLQGGDADEGAGHGGDVERDVGPEALAEQHHARTALRGDRLQPLLDGLEHIAGEHDAIDRLGHRKRTGDKRVLRHDGRAVAAREVFECLDDRVVDVADTCGARDADEGALESTARLEVGDTECGALT